MKQNSVIHDSCLGLAIAAMAPLVIGTDLVTAPSAEAATMTAIQMEEPANQFNSAFNHWWEPIWGEPYLPGMFLVMETDDNGWNTVDLLHFTEGTRGQKQIDYLASAHLEKHHHFAIPTYVSPLVEFDIPLLVDSGDDESDAPLPWTPQTPSGDNSGDVIEQSNAIPVSLPGTLQYTTEYWAVSFHREDEDTGAFIHEAPAVISVVTLTVDLHGPAPDFDGHDSVTIVWPLLKFEVVDDLLEFILNAGEWEGGAALNLICPWGPQGPCYHNCPDLNGCLTIARSSRNTELDKCHCDYNAAIATVGIIAVVAIATAVPTGGISIAIGAGLAIPMWHEVCGATINDCTKDAWSDYRHDVCVCWVNNIAACDENNSGIPSGICP